MFRYNANFRIAFKGNLTWAQLSGSTAARGLRGPTHSERHVEGRDARLEPPLDPELERPPVGRDDERAHRLHGLTSLDGYVELAYLRAQKESLAMLQWLKRYVRAFVKEEKSETPEE